MFKDHKCVVTGGTGALGSDVCRILLDGGAEVHATYIEEGELAYLGDDLKSHRRFNTQRVPLTEEREVSAFFRELGPIQGLCAIAGGFDMAPTRETTLSAWQNMFNMNVTTAFLSCREALRHMASDQHGRIVAVGSYSVMTPSAGLAAYRAAKAALVNLIQSIAEETLTTKITANVVLPTIMDTPANRTAMPDADYSAWVTTAQAAGTIGFLMNPRNGHITGACIPLRGHV